MNKMVDLREAVPSPYGSNARLNELAAVAVATSRGPAASQAANDTTKEAPSPTPGQFRSKGDGAIVSHIMRKQFNIKTNKPKRHMTAYNLFFMLHRQRIVQGREDEPILPEEIVALKVDTEKKKLRIHRRTHGTVSFKDLAIKIAAKWKNLDGGMKEHFEKRAAEGKARYVSELKEWKARVYGEAKMGDSSTTILTGSSVRNKDEDNPGRKEVQRDEGAARPSRALRQAIGSGPTPHEKSGKNSTPHELYKALWDHLHGDKGKSVKEEQRRQLLQDMLSSPDPVVQNLARKSLSLQRKQDVRRVSTSTSSSMNSTPSTMRSKPPQAHSPAVLRPPVRRAAGTLAAPVVYDLTSEECQPRSEPAMPTHGVPQAASLSLQANAPYTAHTYASQGHQNPAPPAQQVQIIYVPVIAPVPAPAVPFMPPLHETPGFEGYAGMPTQDVLARMTRLAYLRGQEEVLLERRQFTI